LGYHGGRVEVFRTHSPSGYCYDVSSMYPAMLAETPLPVQFRGGIRYGRDAVKEWTVGYEGVFKCRIRVPEMFVPPLPVQTDEGIAFPWGSFSGAWPRNEIEYALTLGCEIERVEWSATFDRTERVFKPWVDRLFEARMRFGKETREGKWLKLVSNSLTGKLGSRSERRSIRLWPDFDELRVCECPDLTDCECGAFKPMDSKGRAWESITKSRKVEACAHAHWAAYLTGAARIKLHRQLVAGGRADCVYCDTDSVWSESPRTEGLGHELGLWEPKGAYRDFESLGPKMYHALLDGEEVTAAKGIPNPDWAKLRAGEATAYHSMRGIRRAKKGERFFEMQDAKRIVKANTGRRLPGSDGVTWPPRLVEP